MKKLSKFLTILLLSCLIVPLLIPVNANAATKLNSKSKTLYVGESIKLRVTGTTKTVKWSSSKKSVATVNSSGTVTAKAEGSCTVTAKVSGKSLKCKITVLSKFSSNDAVKKISCELKDTGDGVVAILKNNNSVPVSIDAKLVYYNDSGKMLMSTSDRNYCLEKGATCALFFRGPYDSNYKDVSYSDYKISMSVEESNYPKYAASKIKIKADMGSDNVTAEIKNSSKYNLDSIKIGIVYYDDNNNAIGYNDRYAECKSPDSVDYITFDFPHDSNYDTIQPASYKIFVNSAYPYS